MSLLRRRRGHFMLLGIVAALVLSACGGSSSSSSSKSATSVAPVASATTSSTTAAKRSHVKSRRAKPTPGPRSGKAHPAVAPPPGLPSPGRSRHGKTLPPQQLLHATTVGGGFTQAERTFTQLVYRRIVRMWPAGNARQHATVGVALGALQQVRQGLIFSAQEAQRNSRTADLARRLVGLGGQTQTIFVALIRGQRPASEIQSMENTLIAMAAELKSRGVKVLVTPA